MAAARRYGDRDPELWVSVLYFLASCETLHAEEISEVNFFLKKKVKNKKFFGGFWCCTSLLAAKRCMLASIEDASLLPTHTHTHTHTHTGGGEHRGGLSFATLDRCSGI